MVSLINREDIEEDTRVVMANLLFTCLQFVYRDQHEAENHMANLVIRKIWENQTAFLKLTVMNELLQTFRVTPRILEPLLFSLLILN